MGIECTDDYRKNHPITCFILDWTVGSTFAKMPTVAGAGNAALEPGWTVTGVSVAVKNYILKCMPWEKTELIQLGHNNIPWKPLKN